MPDISLIAMIGAAPTSGIVCSAYKASRFGALPVAYDTAAPGGAADATATSGTFFGGPGQVSLTVPTFEEYWVAVPSGGHIGWVKSPSPVEPESNVTALIADLGLKAPLASPAFTGIVTAPVANINRAYFKGTPTFDPMAYGAVGDGTAHPLSAFYGSLAAAQAVYPHAIALTDEIDWAACQGALNDITARGGTVDFSTCPIAYRINRSLGPKSYTTMLSSGAVGVGGVGARITGPAMTTPLVDPGAGAVYGLNFRGLNLSGNAVSGSKGIYINNGQNTIMEDLFFDNFGDQAVHLPGGLGGKFSNVMIQNSLLVRTGRSSLVGTFDTNVDAYYYGINANASVSAGDGLGNICGILVRPGTNGMFTNCVGAFSQIGIASASAYSRFVGCRGEFNNGPGWEVDGAWAHFVACLAFKNSQATDNTSPGFNTTGAGNSFTDCFVDAFLGDAKQQSVGFVDNNSDGSGFRNFYVGCRKGPIVRGALRTVSGSVAPMALDWDMTAGLVGTGPQQINGSATFTSLVTIPDAINTALRFTFNPVGGMQQIQPTSVSGYTLQTGDYVEYDVYIDPANQLDGKVGLASFGSAWLFWGDAITLDQNGVSVDPNATDLRPYALGRWYSRKIAVPSANVGQSTQWLFAHGGSATGTLVASFRNVRVTNGAGTVRKQIWINPDPNPTFSLAYTGGGTSWSEALVAAFNGGLVAGAQIYPAAEALGGQTSGGVLHSVGVPSNANGNNNDWCISDDGFLYFKTGGVWVQRAAADSLLAHLAGAETFTGSKTLADAVNIPLGTTTGSQIGTATAQKLALHGATPVIQRAGAAQVAAATTAATNTTPYGYTTAAQANAVITLLNEIRAALVEKGIIKGAA